MYNTIIGCLTPGSDFSVLCWTPSGKIHFIIISLSSGFHTCVSFLCLAHCHSSGVSINNVQEKVSRVVVWLTLVACSDSITSPKQWLCARQKAVHGCQEHSHVAMPVEQPAPLALQASKGLCLPKRWSALTDISSGESRVTRHLVMCPSQPQPEFC